MVNTAPDKVRNVFNGPLGWRHISRYMKVEITLKILWSTSNRRYSKHCYQGEILKLGKQVTSEKKRLTQGKMLTIIIDKTEKLEPNIQSICKTEKWKGNWSEHSFTLITAEVHQLSRLFFHIPGSDAVHSASEAVKSICQRYLFCIACPLCMQQFLGSYWITSLLFPVT